MLHWCWEHNSLLILNSIDLHPSRRRHEWVSEQICASEVSRSCVKQKSTSPVECIWHMKRFLLHGYRVRVGLGLDVIIQDANEKVTGNAFHFLGVWHFLGSAILKDLHLNIFSQEKEIKGCQNFKPPSLLGFFYIYILFFSQSKRS